MAEYEITYISDGELPEEARAQLDAGVDALVNDLGGSKSFTSPHIPRRLFFPVKKKRTAGLRALQVELEAAKIDEVRVFLKKQPGVLRFTILNTPHRSEVPAAILDQLRDKRGGRAMGNAPVPTAAAPKTPITMEDVEKGIEKALGEEVK